jgi:signal transduction histidine kinase
VGWIDPSTRIVGTLRPVASLSAALASRIAVMTGRAAPDRAEVVARLAPLGWYAVAAVEPSDALGCLRDPAFQSNPLATQRRWWGLDHHAVARRLSARWRLPAWVAGTLDGLALPLEAARRVVPDFDLFAVVQLAVVEAQTRIADLGLAPMADRAALVAHLPQADDALAGDLDPHAVGIRLAPPSGLDPNPHNVQLVGDLLRLAGSARRRAGASLVVRLEDRVDELHRAAGDLAMQAGARLRDAKLAGLAELAAGAGHEINNPLAVISGNAQRLLRTEPDPDRADSLRAVVRQTQRISGILRDLMHFARPPKPVPRRTAVSELLTAVRDELVSVADDSEVQFELTGRPAGVWLDADPAQLQSAIVAVVRNGIEAAGRGGWVRLGCLLAADTVVVIVEDSGPGLTPAAIEHAFDPFYCGRSAGRGRGLGLSTAWQLVRQNGGDLRHDLRPGHPTRFVLTLPTPDDVPEQLERRSA